MLDIIRNMILENPIGSTIFLSVIIFLFWNWYLNAKWKDEITSNQREIIKLLGGKSDEQNEEN